jgi:hypothetical protein
MHYEVESDRQCNGTCSGETHKVVRVAAYALVPRLTIAVCRRRDIADDLCGEFNSPRSSSVRWMPAAA